MIQLGGNIELEGFDGVEPGKLVVVKKIVGSYARQIADSKENFEKLNLSLSQNDQVDLTATTTLGGEKISSQVSEKNLFYGLDKVFKDLLEKL